MTTGVARSTRAGFSFIEMMIVLVIIAILSAVGMPMYWKWVEKASKESTLASMRTLELAVQSYSRDTGEYPERLRDLVKKPAADSAAKGWDGPYVDKGKLPVDGWKRQFKYKRTPNEKHPYELYSLGPKGAGAPKSDWISVWD